MIRKSLYLAASAAVLITAAQAQAATITGTGVFSGVTSTTGSVAFKLSQELTYFTAYSSASGAAATQATASFDLTPTTSFTVGESLLLTVDIAQGGVFTSSTGFSVTGTGACTVQSTAAVTPIARNATSAQYLVNLSGTCTAAGLTIAAPVQVTGSDMVIGAQLQQSFGGQLINVDGGRAAATFVDVTRAFSATVSASGNNATAEVSSGYRELGSQPALGNVIVTADTAVAKALSTATGSAVSAADIANVALTVTAVTGSFTGINVAYDGDTFNSTSSTATLSTVRVFNLGSNAIGNFPIDIVDNAASGTGINADAVIPASTFTATAAVELAAGLTGFSASGALSSVVRDGTSFVAPWVALGAASANSTIRLANNGSTDTGPIQVTLTASNGSAATTETVTIGAGQLVAGSLSASGGIPAGGVVSISGAALKTAFGTDAANGDLEVTIEAQPQFISGKVRVTQASGQVFESSLGNLRDNNI